MAEILLTDVCKSFAAGVTALNGLNLHAPPGELTVLVGPSGSGKTTLLRVIAGLETPTTGNVTLDGRPIAGRRPAQRGVGMVFQSPALYPYLSVEGHLRHAVRRMGLDRDQQATRVRETAERLDLMTLLNRRPHQLSGGEAQRVALGRALVRRPDVLLLDEPLSSLDAPLRLQLRRQIKQLQREYGVTMLYVTHDQAEALALADRLAVIAQGAVRQQATPRQVYRDPADQFVASFIGSPGMNLIAGEVRDGRFLAPGVMYPVAHDSAGPVTLGVRPEDVYVGSGSSAGFATGVVACVEPLGAETLITVQVAEAVIVVRTANYASPLGVADPVNLGVRPEGVRLFEAGAWGKRLACG